MDKHCVHHIPETKRGVGPCNVRWEVKKRNGRPNWWCRTHGLEASAPDGGALGECSAAWLEPVDDDMRIELDLESGEVAIWGAIGPALDIGTVPPEAGGVHVHRRPTVGKEKDIDRSFDIVRVHRGQTEAVIEGMAARALSISELCGMPVDPWPVLAARKSTSTN